MWVISAKVVGLILIGLIAILAIIAWRVWVWLDRWAGAMIACFPKLLQLSQEKQLTEGRETVVSPDAKTASSTAVSDPWFVTR